SDLINMDRPHQGYWIEIYTAGLLQYVDSLACAHQVKPTVSFVSQFKLPFFQYEVEQIILRVKTTIQVFCHGYFEARAAGSIPDNIDPFHRLFPIVVGIAETHDGFCLQQV